MTSDGAVGPIRVGIIGAGDIVRAVHLPVLHAMPEVAVAWLTDLDATRARELARAYRVRDVVLPSDLSNLPTADVMLLATPLGVRDAYYDALVERKQALYVEKPFAIDLAQHRRTSSRFPEHALASGLMMRAFGPTQGLRRLLDHGLFGPLRSVRVGFGRPGLVTHGRFYFDASRGGGGFVSEVGIHGIDTLLFASGARAFAVRELHVIRDDDGFDLHTHAELSLDTPHGSDVRCEITLTALENTREEVVFDFDRAELSYPLVGQGYALVGDAVSYDIRVRPRAGGAVYTLRPGEEPFHPVTKFQTFAAYWSDYLEGVRNAVGNYTTATAAELTSALVGALAGEEDAS